MYSLTIKYKTVNIPVHDFLEKLSQEEVEPSIDYMLIDMIRSNMAAPVGQRTMFVEYTKDLLYDTNS